MVVSRDRTHWLREPSVNIAGCLYEYQQMRSGSVYWLSMDKHINALRFATQALAGLDLDSRAVLVGSEQVSAVVGALDSSQGPADLRTYILKRDIPTAVLRLTEQLDRKLNPVKRLIICLLPIDTLHLLKNDPQAALQTWRNWCESNGCIMLVLAYGENAHVACQLLLHESRFLSGAAHLKAQENDYVYEIDYWINSLGVQQSAEFILQDKNMTFQLVKTALKQALIAQDDVFLQRSVLEGAPVVMAKTWHVVDDWDGLVSAAREVARGTFVFALDSSDELEALARMLYALRQQRGVTINLVVREMKQVLRNQEVQLLQECGAALVVSADTNLSRVFSMLENIPYQQNSLPLTQDIETALAQIKVPDIKGIVTVFEFANYLRQILTNAYAVESVGVLITLRPVPMLTAQQLMGQLNLLRKGDVACTADGVVYLFLFGCQLDFVEIALQRIFYLPFKDIVSMHKVHSDTVSIEDQVRYLQIQKPAQIPGFFAATHEEGVITELVERNRRKTDLSTVKFKPHLQPLQLFK